MELVDMAVVWKKIDNNKLFPTIPVKYDISKAKLDVSKAGFQNEVNPYDEYELQAALDQYQMNQYNY